jgi:two-component system, NarL family, sensor kinase
MLESLARSRLAIGVLCGFVFLLEIVFPINYVFGHLYIAPLLLSSFSLSSKTTTITARIVVFLATIDFVILELLHTGALAIEKIPAYTLINRLNVIVVLLLTNWLIRRNFKYIYNINLQEAEITHQKADLLAQKGLAQIREDFVHTLTHDLKTPILGAIQIIKSFQQKQFGAVNDLQLKVLDTMTQSQQRSLELVETLLDIYRNDAEGLTLNLQLVDLWQIAKEAVDTVLILSSEREIKLNLKSSQSQFKSEEQPMKIRADSLQLIRVFINLLGNAIYHSPRAGQIEVIVDQNNHQYVVQIIDNGQGLNPADIPLLFDRFYQAHNQARGSGLGLYLSRQIVEAHGGKIWAEPGVLQGTMFCFSLPVGTVNNV